MQKLTAHEKELFINEGLVERRKLKEGNRVFTAFHSADFVSKLIHQVGFKMPKYIPGKIETWGVGQDTYLIQKKIIKDFFFTLFGKMANEIRFVRYFYN